MPRTIEPRALARSGFLEVLQAAVNDLAENGFDSVERVAKWTRELRAAAERSMVSPASLEQMLRDGLAAIYRRMVDQDGLLKFNPGVSRFTKERVRPALRAEFDRRILASASLIRLNRTEAIEKTLRRFQGWSTSIPPGGAPAETRAEAKRAIRKSLASLPFEERRVLVDQGHKLTSALSEILATDGGAIAAVWRSNWRQPGYDYRVDHKERDGEVYLVRGSWAATARLVKAGSAGYLDAVTAPGQEVYCRCYVTWLYNLRDLPDAMLTEKGKAALLAARDQEERRRARADAAGKATKEQARYVGPGVDRPHGFMCEECTMFRLPDDCTAVEREPGGIAPAGYCEFFHLKRAVA